MFCTKCGAKMPEGTKFCEKCGTPVKEEQPETVSETVSPTRADENVKSGKKGLLIGGVIGGIVLAAAAVVVLLIGRSGKAGGNGSMPDGRTPSGEVNEAATGVVEEDVLAAAENWDDLEPLYTDVQPGSIYIYAENTSPESKAPGMTWDSSVFYWLEDADTQSDEDGNIAYCHVFKTYLINADNGNLIQYEVYKDASTGEIYKIVSIEPAEDGTLKLVDYYYKNGELNFIFMRNDSVYTPIYATIDKVGDRYYFNGNVMVRARLIQVPQQIMECTLAPEDTWYPQVDYFAADDAYQSNYETMERRVLNAGVNTYNAIAGIQAVGRVEGRVQDGSGTPIAGAQILILRSSDNTLLYKTTSGEDGLFSMYVYLDGEECYLKAAAGTEYRILDVMGLNLSESSLQYTYGNLALHRIGEETYPVTVYALSSTAAEMSSGDLVRYPLSGADVSFRAGVAAYDGEPLMTVQAGADGSVTADLEAGTYTAELSLDNYLTTYLEVQVGAEQTAYDCYMVPKPSEGTTAVLLTWDDPSVDLDLMAFTPYQSSGGDMAHVGGDVASDEHGNVRIWDNSRGCEMLFLNTSVQGSYKLYVNDYTNSTAGNYSATALLNINVHIYIYDSNGLLAVYTVPVGQNGVVWEVAEITQTSIVPAQRVYYEVSGKTWWTDSKDMGTQEELEAALAVKDSWGNSGPLMGLLESIAHYYIGDGQYIGSWNSATGNWEQYRGSAPGEFIKTQINSMCGGNSFEILAFLGIYSEALYHVPPVDYITSEYDCDYALTKDMLEYVAASITGKNIVFSDSYASGSLYKFGTGGAGDNTYNYFENVSVEQYGSLWRVYAEVWYGVDSMDEYTTDYKCKVGDIVFLLKNNPGSCYGGYSIVGVESITMAQSSAQTTTTTTTTTTNNMAWKDEYISKLAQLENEVISNAQDFRLIISLCEMTNRFKAA